jgi:nucleoside-diphosphate-sugar epimerase
MFERKDLEQQITGRAVSLFQEDFEQHLPLLREAFGRSRIAVIGAAGSVGGAVTKELVRLRPRGLALLDINENNLVEVVRDLRASTEPVPEDFVALPIGMGSIECERFFSEARPFDYFFNLSAIKHVRSEKDIYSLIRMIETNVVFPHRLLSQLRFPVKRFFSVSSDKATNPASLMGASKNVMEAVLLSQSNQQQVSFARFANVAFSDGSLPQGILKRIEKRQAIAAPRDIRRFFVSHEEAAQLCLLAATVANNRELLFPKLEKDLHEQSFCNIAVRLLESLGYRPVECTSEEEAKASAARLILNGEWPCYFTSSDTSGEKESEEFYSNDDKVDWGRLRTIGVIRRNLEEHDLETASRFLDFAASLRHQSIEKAAIVEAFVRAVPSLSHLETGKNLDQKM